MQYLTEDGFSGFFNCDERVVISKAQELANNYFAEETDANTYSVLIVDFEKRTHSILKFSIDRNITVTEY